MIVDYFLIRKRRLNVPELYSATGQFHYFKGVNPAGLIAWLAAGGLAFYSGQWAFVVGLFGGIVFYFILMKFWIMQKYPQKEIGETDKDAYLATSAGINWSYDEQMGSFPDE